MLTTFLIWIIAGLLTGLILSLLIHMHGQDLTIDGLLGLAGAVLGGIVFAAFASADTVQHWHVVLSAVLGGAILVALEHAIRWSLPPDFRWR